jgi:hypothetical protein
LDPAAHGRCHPEPADLEEIFSEKGYLQQLVMVPFRRVFSLLPTFYCSSTSSEYNTEPSDALCYTTATVTNSTDHAFAVSVAAVGWV